MTSSHGNPTILIIGASRGLGHAMAAELLGRGWNVVGTVRDTGTRSPLHELADAHPDRVAIESLDITEPDRITDLHGRLSGRAFDILFVNAGTTTESDVTVGAVTTEEFVHVMVTNVLSPMRVVDALQDLVTPTGLIGAMTSGQGSITNNATGMREVYRASKAALNMSMRSYAARTAGSGRPLALIAPGWIRTALGGPDAPFTMDEAVPRVVDVLLAKRDRPGLEYLDQFGDTVPW